MHVSCESMKKIRILAFLSDIQFSISFFAWLWMPAYDYSNRFGHIGFDLCANTIFLDEIFQSSLPSLKSVAIARRAGVWFELLSCAEIYLHPFLSNYLKTEVTHSYFTQKQFRKLLKSSLWWKLKMGSASCVQSLSLQSLICWLRDRRQQSPRCSPWKKKVTWIRPDSSQCAFWLSKWRHDMWRGSAKQICLPCQRFTCSRIDALDKL